MLNLTDVKRMCGSQPDDVGMGDWGVEFVEVRHHPHHDMPTPSTYGHALFVCAVQTRRPEIRYPRL